MNFLLSYAIVYNALTLCMANIVILLTPYIYEKIYLSKVKQS